VNISHVAIALSATACASRADVQTSVDHVEPASALNVADTPVRIEGSGFHFAITNSLDNGKTSPSPTLEVTLGDLPLVDPVWVDEQHVDAVVPSGLAPGPYDVTVSIGGQRGMLAGGFTVEALGAFSAPTPIVPLASTALDDDPTMTADGLELYFNSDRPGGTGSADIWVSTRTSRSDPWGPPAPVTAVNTIDLETTPGVSADGLELYWSSDTPGGMGGTDIYRATRASRSDPWSSPMQVSELATTFAEHGVQPTASGLTLVFNSDRSGATQLYMTTRATKADPWTTPVPIAELGAFADADPALVDLERTLVFHSQMRGGLGSTDIFITSRASTQDPFGTPNPLTELNSTASDSDCWMSEDTRHVVFTSDRSGVSQIYEASR